MPSHSSDTAILIVEDNAAMRALIRSLVERPGAAVHECTDAEAALTLYPALQPDWVLMDIKLGRMDGIAATRALRASHPGARIIIVTEQRDPGYRIAAADAGASGFLLKEDLLSLPALLDQLGTDAPRVRP